GRGLDPLPVRHHVRAVIRRPVTVHITGDREAVARERDRGIDGLGPGDRAVARERLMQPRHRSGDADRLVADVIYPALEHVAVAVGGLADEKALPLVLAAARTGGGVELEQRVARLRAVDQHHAAAADSTHLGVDDTLDEGARDGGINRVPAALHDLEADLGRDRLRADDYRHELKG